MTRRIAFEAIDNFRDFGGYAAGGRRLKSGLLYRAGHMAKATDADLEKLQGLGVAVVVDLRRPIERAKQPNRQHPDFTGEVVSSDTMSGGEDDLSAFLKEAGSTPEAVRTYMRNYYRTAPFTPRHIELYSRYLRALAEAPGSILVHCAAGKDRTGIICALTHHVAGVGEADIVEDYLLTNDPERIARRLPMMARYVGEALGHIPSDEALTIAMSCEVSYLTEAFDAMRRDYGSLDGYLEGALGLDGALRDRIHARLLA